MTDAEIYREAAALVANEAEDYCCCAITKVTGKLLAPQERAFERIFAPLHRHGAYWLTCDSPDCCSGYGEDHSAPETRDLRVLMLCFMAAIAEAGDLES